MDKTIGWYAGYLLALAHRGETVLVAEDRAILNEASVLLQRLHAERPPC